ARLKNGVVAGFIVALECMSTRGAKCRDAGTGQLELASHFEESHVARTRTRPASFNEIYTQCIELFGNAALVLDGKVNALALRTITKSGVVDFNSVIHRVMRP